MSHSTRDRKPLGPLDAIGLVVGIIIGAGIFESPTSVFAAVSDPVNGLLLWVAGAVVSVCGALCYAELAATYPTDAGEAEYLTHAFGSFAGWYFTWVQLVCVRTAAAVVSIAYIFAKFAGQLQPAPNWLYAGGAVILLTGVNALGLRPGKLTQNSLAIVKVLAIMLLVLIGFSLPAIDDPAGPLPEPTTTLAFAVVVIMYTYSGWHEAAYIVGDLRTPRKSLPRALLAGVAIVTAVYLSVNLAAWHTLGFEGVRNSAAFGTDMLKRAHSKPWAFNALVVLVTLGSINGTILSGSRLFGAVGVRQSGYGWLARFRTRRDAPLVALAVQAGLCLAMVGALEMSGSGTEGFERVVAATSPALWLIFLLAGLSLVVLRLREPNRDRPYRVPFYPIVPIIYIASCVFMLYESIDYALSKRGPEWWLTLGLLAVGLPYWWLVGRGSASSKRR